MAMKLPASKRKWAKRINGNKTPSSKRQPANLRLYNRWMGEGQGWMHTEERGEYAGQMAYISHTSAK